MDDSEPLGRRQNIRHRREHLYARHVHKRGSLSTRQEPLSTLGCLHLTHSDQRPASPRSVGVEQFAKSPDVPPEIVVVSHLALDLLAAM